MLEGLSQYVVTGLTVGATYAMVALGFSIIYNASDVVNFSQGEFVMIGAMSAITFVGLGISLPIAILAAVAVTVMVGILLEKLAIEPAKNASVVTTIIITIGASIFLRGIALLVWGKDIKALHHFSGEKTISFIGATILPQHIWIMFGTGVTFFVLWYFFEKTMLGMAMRASSYNKKAASLVGINVKKILLVAYGLSAALGAIAGTLIAPITFMTYNSGAMLGLKGFCAAILGGMGSSIGAVAGGLLLGIIESFSSGYISSGYKDAISFFLILVVLFLHPSGLFGKKDIERV